jgi:Fur family transcriptional regulator, zinc uptake regulator
MKQRRSQDALQVATVAPISEAKAYEEHALRELRSAGYRITMPRVQVIRALADTSTALSAYAIHEKIIGSGGKIDVVSVYRILATLQEVGLIHHIGVVDGYFPCRLPGSHGKRSEVVVCEPTLQVIELELPEAVVQAIQEQAKRHGFNPVSIKVEVTSSVCPNGKR